MEPVGQNATLFAKRDFSAKSFSRQVPLFAIVKKNSFNSFSSYHCDFLSEYYGFCSGLMEDRGLDFRLEDKKGEG